MTTAVVRAVICIMFVASLMNAHAFAETANGATPPTYTMFTPINLKWISAPKALPKGAKMAVLEGNSNHNGSYTIRFKFPPNYQIQAHTSTNTEYLTVISGTLYMGAGDKLDQNASRALPPGSFIALPKNVPHYLWTKEKTIVQIHGNHKWNVKYIDSANDPRQSPLSEKEHAVTTSN